MNDLSIRPDEELAEELKNGNHAALDELFNRYYTIVLGIGRRVVRDGDQARDVAQDVFLAIFRAAQEYDPSIAKFRTWIISVAYHKAIDRKKRLISWGYYRTDGLDETFQAPSASWESASIRSLEVQAYLQEALSRLSEKQRRVIQHHIFEGIDLRDVAPLMKESVRNTRSYYHRGLDKMKAVIRALEKRRNYDEMKRAQGASDPRSGVDRGMAPRIARGS